MKNQVKGAALRVLIQDEIKKIITDNNLRPGDFLPPEGQIASALGVSRGSVRETVKSMESLGIVEAKHGEGIRVREFNFDAILGFLSYGLVFQPSRVSEILQTREWLEEAAIIPAAASISEEQLDALDALLLRWEAKVKAGRPGGEEDREFHRRLYAPLENGSLISLIDVFWVVYNSLETVTIQADADPSLTVRNHRDIYNALRRRDAALAQKCLNRHFRNIEQRIRSAVKNGLISTKRKKVGKKDGRQSAS